MSVTELKKANGEILKIIDGLYVIGANSGCFSSVNCRKIINGEYVVTKCSNDCCFANLNTIYKNIDIDLKLLCNGYLIAPVLNAYVNSELFTWPAFGLLKYTYIEIEEFVENSGHPIFGRFMIPVSEEGLCKELGCYKAYFAYYIWPPPDDESFNYFVNTYNVQVAANDDIVLIDPDMNEVYTYNDVSDSKAILFYIKQDSDCEKGLYLLHQYKVAGIQYNDIFKINNDIKINNFPV